MLSYKKDAQGYLIFDGGEIQEVALLELIEAVNLEFNMTPFHEIVVFGAGLGGNMGKLRVGPSGYSFFQALRDGSVQAQILPVRTLSQVINTALRFPFPKLNEIIVFWSDGALCLSMEKK